MNAFMPTNNELRTMKQRLNSKKQYLIDLSNNHSIPMKEWDRKSIKLFFKEGRLPDKPTSVQGLLQTFYTCCFTYAPLRKWLTSLNGNEIPLPNDLPKILATIFSCQEFLKNDNWNPTSIYHIASKIQKVTNYDSTSKQFKPRIVRVLLDGSQEMKKRLNKGINFFYSEIDKINSSSASLMWSYVNNFAKNIYHVGTALICDFLKDIGCYNFVKIDHHLAKEFPKLLPTLRCNKLSPKKHFELSIQIAKLLEMTPFHLDYLLYQWGRYGNQAEKHIS